MANLHRKPRVMPKKYPYPAHLESTEARTGPMFCTLRFTETKVWPSWDHIRPIYDVADVVSESLSCSAYHYISLFKPLFKDYLSLDFITIFLI